MSKLLTGLVLVLAASGLAGTAAAITDDPPPDVCAICWH